MLASKYRYQRLAAAKQITLKVSVVVDQQDGCGRQADHQTSEQGIGRPGAELKPVATCDSNQPEEEQNKKVAQG